MRLLTALRRALPLTLIGAALFLPSSASATEYRVDDVTDKQDAALGDGNCRTADGACTLRAAVMESALHPGESTTVVVPAGRYELEIAPALDLIDATGPLHGDLNSLSPATGVAT